MLRRLADIYDRIFQRITLIIYYYIPVCLAHIQPFQRRPNIRDIHPGFVSFQNGKYAIYVLWQPRTIPWYVINMLEGLRDQEVNTIVVSNHRLLPEQLATLQGLAAEVLIRGNRGLDFGAYKDAILRLIRGAREVRRLLILNDSAYVFRRGLAPLLKELLEDKYPVVSAYENWELHYHLQSFCIGLAGSIVYDPIFQQYWERYRPISIRRWCIHAGEVKLSKALRKIAQSFRIVFGVNDLLGIVATDADVPTLLQYREFFPRPIRRQFPSDDVLSSLQRSKPDKRRIIIQRLKEVFSEGLALRAQAHTGAFFFLKFRSSPFLKRDIVYRELFSVYEVERMLAELGYEAESQAILDDMRRRGTAAHLTGFEKRQYRLGII